MSKWLSEQMQKKWLFNITIALFVLFSLDAIATAFVSVMIDTTWEQLTGTQRWIRVALVLKAWASAMVAFLTNASKKLQKDELPFDGGDTTHITKVSLTETTKTKGIAE